MKKRINVAGAAIISGNRVIAAQRLLSPKKYASLKWEFPGGKLEDNETEREAIIREIKEELGCEIEPDRILTVIDHEYPDFILHMTVFICSLRDNGTPNAIAHNAVKWCTYEELYNLDWADADAKIYPLLKDILDNRVSNPNLRQETTD